MGSEDIVTIETVGEYAFLNEPIANIAVKAKAKKDVFIKHLLKALKENRDELIRVHRHASVPIGLVAELSEPFKNEVRGLEKRAEKAEAELEELKERHELKCKARNRVHAENKKLKSDMEKLIVRSNKQAEALREMYSCAVRKDINAAIDTFLSDGSLILNEKKEED